MERLKVARCRLHRVLLCLLKQGVGSQGPHTVIIQTSPLSANMSPEEKPVLSLWMSPVQTGIVSGPV